MHKLCKVTLIYVLLAYLKQQHMFLYSQDTFLYKTGLHYSSEVDGIVLHV